jgi:hypothetical protein
MHHKHRIIVLMHRSGQKMEMATLLCLLPDHDLQPKLLQSWCLIGLDRSSLVAWHDRRSYWIDHFDCPRRAQQPWCDQVLHRLSGLRSSGGRCSRRQFVHSCSSYSCHYLLRHADVLWRSPFPLLLLENAIYLCFVGRITSVFMRGIFGNGYHNIPNHLPASAGITSRDLLSFFLFWMVSNMGTGFG